MAPTGNINRPIIEALYCEALVLADEVRSMFDLNPIRETGDEADRTRLALSVEGLRTTTRVMHVLAWLLNYRAFFSGELNELQLRRHSKLPVDRIPEPANMARLESPVRALIGESVRMHARVRRLDAEWSEQSSARPVAIHAMQTRLSQGLRKR